MRGQRPRHRLAGAALLLAALLTAALLPATLGCALPSARWDVPAGAGERFADARKACHQLSSPSQERFEDCMRRRGFERESFWRRARRGITGG